MTDKTKELKLTGKILAEFFGVSERTINGQKNSKDAKMLNRYKAFKEFYLNNVAYADKTAVQMAAVKMGECLELINSLDISQVGSK